MNLGEPWRLFTREECLARGRCVHCCFDPPTQGHRDGCPDGEQ